MCLNAKLRIVFKSIMLQKKTATCITVFMLFFVEFYAQTPDWSVEENNFEYTMTMVAFLSVDKTRLGSDNDKVAAFVGDDVRGVTNLIYVESENSYFAYLTIFANTNGETICFKIYDSVQRIVKDVETTMKFNILAHHGSLTQAFSIGSPKLSKETDIFDLDFEEFEVVGFSQNDDIVTLNLLDAGELSLSTILFEISEGANLLQNGEIINSGVTKLNLEESPLKLQMRSEDQSILRAISLEIHFIEASQPRFFRKNEVCHAKGAIKVIYNEEGSNVLLKKDGDLVSERLINNSEVIFNDLEAGTYQVVSASVTKTIIIDHIVE
jgi:hypothetical protein